MLNFHNRAHVLQPYMLSVLRIMSSLLLLQHGTAKIFGFPHVDYFDNLEIFSLVGIAGMIEIVGGILLLIGFLTRPTAFILSGELAFAYFLGHASQGFFPILNGGELAVLYTFIFLYLAVAGSGKWGVDYVVHSKSNNP